MDIQTVNEACLRTIAKADRWLGIELAVEAMSRANLMWASMERERQLLDQSGKPQGRRPELVS